MFDPYDDWQDGTLNFTEAMTYVFKLLRGCKSNDPMKKAFFKGYVKALTVSLITEEQEKALVKFWNKMSRSQSRFNKTQLWDELEKVMGEDLPELEPEQKKKTAKKSAKGSGKKATHKTASKSAKKTASKPAKKTASKTSKKTDSKPAPKPAKKTVKKPVKKTAVKKPGKKPARGRK